MAYVTQAQLEAAVGAGDLKAWTDDDASGAIDASVVSAALELASGLVDAAVVQHYRAPLTLSDATTAQVVRAHVLALAAYRLAARRGDAAAQAWRKLYDEAQAWLKALREGKQLLAGETSVASALPTGGVIVAGGSAKITRETMDGW